MKQIITIEVDTGNYYEDQEHVNEIVACAMDRHLHVEVKENDN